jgi:hypothetical protein
MDHKLVKMTLDQLEVPYEPSDLECVEKLSEYTGTVGTWGKLIGLQTKLCDEMPTRDSGKSTAAAVATVTAATLQTAELVQQANACILRDLESEDETAKGLARVMLGTVALLQITLAEYINLHLKSHDSFKSVDYK